MSSILSPIGSPSALDAYLELSPREAEVLALVAEGWSNRAVAERLFVTVRTVESHVRTILVKFGVCADDRVSRRVLLARLWTSRPAGVDDPAPAG
jgi:DNA-binding NarL/FixJ family response regulator